MQKIVWRKMEKYSCAFLYNKRNTFIYDSLYLFNILQLFDSKHQQISKQQCIKQKEMEPTRIFKIAPFLLYISWQLTKRKNLSIKNQQSMHYA